MQEDLYYELKTAKDGLVAFFFIALYHIRFEVNYWRNHLPEND